MEATEGERGMEAGLESALRRGETEPCEFLDIVRGSRGLWKREREGGAPALELRVRVDVKGHTTRGR